MPSYTGLQGPKSSFERLPADRRLEAARTLLYGSEPSPGPRQLGMPSGRPKARQGPEKLAGYSQSGGGPRIGGIPGETAESRRFSAGMALDQAESARLAQLRKEQSRAEAQAALQLAGKTLSGIGALSQAMPMAGTGGVSQQALDAILGGVGGGGFDRWAPPVPMDTGGSSNWFDRIGDWFDRLF